MVVKMVVAKVDWRVVVLVDVMAVQLAVQWVDLWGD